jgi:tRNA(fMet)-specific endonuclease VapC
VTSLHMLDTDIASYLIRDVSKPAVERLAGIPPANLCISVITRAELLYGLAKIDPGHRLHLGVAKFLAAIRSFAWPEEAAANYAAIRHQLVSSGKPIGELDMMIAAHAIALKAVLVTNNVKHYQRIDMPLVVENWADGAGST